MFEQLIKEKAYQIWEAEGYPEGRAEVHWELARRVVEEAPIEEPAAKKRVSKPRSKKAKS